MTELPSPPFINVPGVANFRDVGGYPCQSITDSTPPASHAQQRSIRRGLLFRSADFNKIQPDGLTKVKDLGIRKVFDFRSSPELKSGSSFGDLLGSNNTDLSDAPIERIWTPVFAEQDYGPDKVARRAQLYATSGSAGFVQAYRDILDSGIDAFRVILAHLASEAPPEPCLVHCTAGKDRTGVFVAIVLVLCGVFPEVASSEYALTDLGLAHMKRGFVEKAMAAPGFEGGRAKAEDMISSKRENMLATLKMIEDVYGGVERYVTEVLALDADTLRRLRRNLISTDKPTL